jgi:aspartate racemase
MAQQFTAAGEPVGLLAVFDNPGIGHSSKPPLLKRLGMHLERLWHLSHIERGRYLLKAASLAGLKGKEIYEHLRRPANQKRLIRASKKASDQYHAKPYPGPITVFRATQGQVSFDFWNDRGPLLGWEMLAEGGVDLRDIPISRDGMFEEPSVRILAKALRTCLDSTIVESVVHTHASDPHLV